MGNPQKILLIIILFFLFALLQNTFFAQFNLFGANLNLVFILYILILFFEVDTGYFLWAIIAGFLLDIFSYTSFGPSIVLLIIIGFLLKKTQALLKNKEEKFPFSYFLPLFAIFLLIYELFLSIYFHYFDLNKIAMISGWQIVYSIIYNSIIASALFYIYTKWLKNTK